MLLYFVHLTVPCWHQLELYRSEASLDRLPSRCTAWQEQYPSSSFRPASPITLKYSLSSVKYFVDASVMACCLQFGHFLLRFCRLCSCCFLDTCVQALGHLLSGLAVFWMFVGLSCTHLYRSGNLVRTIWNLAVPLHASERLFREMVYARLSLSNYVDVFRWDREWFHCLGRTASNEVLPDVDR